MGMAISLAGGLVVGLVLLIWGLRERRLRYQAESEAQAAKAANHKAWQQAGEFQAQSKNLVEELHKANKQADLVRGLLLECRMRLATATANDPKEVREWLDKELGEPL